VFGYDTVEEMMAVPHADFYFDPDDRQRLLQKLAAGGRIHDAVGRSRKKEGSAFWVSINALYVRDASGCVAGIEGSIRDISERKAAETQILKLGRMYAALSRCNEAIIRCTSEEQLFQSVCQTVVEAGGVQSAWIGIADSGSGLVMPVAHFGAGADYVRGLRIAVGADDPFGRGPTGTAIRENKPQWCQDFREDPRLEPWRARAEGFGWKASAALPLHKCGVVVGAITLYAGEAGAFDEAIRDLLREMSTDISYALDNLVHQAELARYADEAGRVRTALLSVLEDQRAAQAALRESEERFRGFVENAIDIVFSLSSEALITYVSPNWLTLMGEPASDAIGKPIVDYIHPSDVHLCRRFLRETAATEQPASVEYRALNRSCASWRWRWSRARRASSSPTSRPRSNTSMPRFLAPRLHARGGHRPEPAHSAIRQDAAETYDALWAALTAGSPGRASSTTGARTAASMSNSPSSVRSASPTAASPTTSR
jgi:PAS domain S-box-containing protein